LKKDSNTIQIEESDLPLNEQVKAYEREILTRKLEKYGGSSNAKDLAARISGSAEPPFTQAVGAGHIPLTLA